MGYFRIKQVDKNGRTSYSVILKLENNNSDNVSVYPTITKGLASISVSNVKLLNTSISIMNSYGQIAERILLLNQVQQINVSYLAKGMYFIRFENGEVRKIIKD